MFRSDPFPRVGDYELDLLAATCGENPDAAAGGCVAERVVENVREYLGDAVGVDVDVG